MGAKASKPAQAATRRFPTRSSPGSAVPPTTTRPRDPATLRSPREAKSAKDAGVTFSKEEAIEADCTPASGSTTRTTESAEEAVNSAEEETSADPAFSRRLQQMGVATPNPTLSNSSIASRSNTTTNPNFSSSSSSPSSSTPTTTAMPSSSSSPFGPAPTSAPGSAPIFPSPSTNPVLGTLAARRALQAEAERQFESPASEGRGFVDVGTLRQALAVRERDLTMAANKRGGAAVAARGDEMTKMVNEQVEARFRLRKGMMERLGVRGTVTPLGVGGSSTMM